VHSLTLIKVSLPRKDRSPASSGTVFRSSAAGETVSLSVLVCQLAEKNSKISGEPMDSITLKKHHIHTLTNESLREEFIAGIVSLLQGKEPKATCSHMEDVFDFLAHYQGPKVIPGIPRFDPAGITKNELERYNRVQAGKVPSTGLDHSYKDLKFKPITTLDKGYLSGLYNDCLGRINSNNGSVEYRKFVSYLAEVMKHCANSGEL